MIIVTIVNTVVIKNIVTFYIAVIMTLNYIHEICWWLSNENDNILLNEQ